ncbi:MAG: FAD-dependent oxidoreductase [Lachnospiraceae bacterium]|nr:FAD-dependent oxidoreductase [Lachnospiraceae bacterium]
MKHYSYTYDIAVIGAGPSGLAAAIVAARAGKKVILLEKNGYLGGNMAIGLPPLGFLDENGTQIIAGFGQEFIDRLQERGQSYGHRYCPKHNSTSNMDAEGVKILAIEMCREAGVDIILHCETQKVEVENGEIKSITMYGKCNEIVITADIYIDCTGDGDVAYLAGCSYNMGRNGGELMAPTVMCTLENVDNTKLFDYIEEHPEEMIYGAGSLIDTKPGYDADYFRASPNHIFVGMTKLFERLGKEGTLPVNRQSMIIINGLNPGQVYVNTTRLLDVDATDILDLTRAELDGQTQLKPLVEMFRAHVPGFENCYISSICPNLGVRETRRFKGIRCVNVDEAMAGEIPEDTVVLSGYKLDIHSGKNNTTLFKTVTRPFGVPYGTMVSAEISNLMFSGRCISVDESVIGSTRIMSVCMCLGQAAAIGACMALDGGVTPGEIDVSKLRETLLSQGAILDMPE